MLLERKEESLNYLVTCTHFLSRVSKMDYAFIHSFIHSILSFLCPLLNIGCLFETLLDKRQMDPNQEQHLCIPLAANNQQSFE
mmetsp:Transcript_10089/g.18905  ORF Transcript_10089/g.18905 Transcript_10089/m.18905 type:complete len:83 (+) Transcript_10089:947-1195(+)